MTHVLSHLIKSRDETLEDQVDSIRALLEDHTARLQYLQQTVDGYAVRFDVLEDRLDRLEQRMEAGFAMIMARLDTLFV